MKKSILISLSLVVIFFSFNLKAQQISPYISLGEAPESLEQTEKMVINALEASGFEILGQYHVENNQTLKVIVYSRKDLQQITLKVKDRGALAAALKVGLKADGPGTQISYLNPEYLFQAYLRNSYDAHSKGLKKVDADAKAALSPLGQENKEFGGSMTVEELREYQTRNGGEIMPSSSKINAEILLNNMNVFTRLAGFYMLLGLAFLFFLLC